MRRTTPSHPPLTVLGYTDKGRPIRFIGGGSTPIGDPIPPAPTPVAPVAPAPPVTPPAPNAPEEPLGAPGLRALQAERERAATAEADLAAAKAQIAQFEQANLSELERERTRAEQAEATLATERTQRLRLQTANTHQIPAEHLHLLTATTEADLTAQATSVAALLANTPRPPAPLPGQGTPPAAPATASVDAGRELWRKKHPQKTT